MYPKHSFVNGLDSFSVTYLSFFEVKYGSSKQVFYLSHDMRFPTMWYVPPAKLQISLRICAVWSEPLLVAWIFYNCLATDWTAFEVSKLKSRLHRLV